jgi:hypothetical protein
MGQRCSLLNVEKRLKHDFAGGIGTFLGLEGLDEALVVARLPPSTLKFKAITLEGLLGPRRSYA